MTYIKLLLYFFFFCLSFSARSQTLYIQMEVGECFGCVKAIAMLGEYEPLNGRRFLVFNEILRPDSVSVLDKYGVNIEGYKVIWSDSLFNAIGNGNAISKAVLVGGDGAILDRQHLKQMDTIPDTYQSVFFPTSPSPKVFFPASRSFQLKYSNASSSKFSFQDIDKLKFQKKQNWCDLPIPGRANILPWKESAVIHNQIDNFIYVVNAINRKVDTIGLKPTDMEFYFETLYGSRSKELYINYLKDAKEDPGYRPNVVSLFADSSCLYFCINVYYNVQGNSFPGFLVGYYRDGKSYYFPVNTESYYAGNNVFGFVFFAINSDSLVMNSFNANKVAAGMAPSDSASMLALWVKDSSGKAFHFEKSLDYYYEDIYSKIGNNLVNISAQYPKFTYLMSRKVYDIRESASVFTLPVSNFDFSSVNSVSDVVQGPIPYRNIGLCFDPDDTTKGYLLYSVSKSGTDRKVYLLYFSYKTGEKIYEKEIREMPPLNQVMSFGLDGENKKIYYVENYGRCIEFIDFSDI